MHSRDRRWPIMFVMVGVLLAMFPALYVALYRLVGEAPQWMVSPIDWSSLNTWQNLYIVVVAIIFLLKSAPYTLRARRRERSRAKALAGDVRAMPVASIKLEAPEQAAREDITHKPFALRWANDSVITATEEGLLWQRPKKRDVQLTWNEARLFEIWERSFLDAGTKYEIFEHGYCLYARPRKYIEWTDAPESQVAGERLSWEQKDQLQKELLIIVSARTRLPLRIVANGHSTQNSAEKRRRISVMAPLTFAFLLLLAAFPLATGILALTAPLTRTFTLNLYVAIIDGGIGLFLIGLLLWAMLNSILPHKPTPPPPLPVMSLPDVPPAVTNTTSISVRFGTHLRDRLIALLLMVATLVSTVYLVVRSVQDFPDSDFKQPSFTDLHALALGMLGTCAFLGIMLIGTVLFSRRTILLADEAGFHWGTGKKREFILWSDVAMLLTKVSHPNELKSLSVIEAPPQSNTISWPAHARWIHQPDGASPDDAGAQFAAIVAQRAGVQPTTRWE